MWNVLAWIGCLTVAVIAAQLLYGLIKTIRWRKEKAEPRLYIYRTKEDQILCRSGKLSDGDFAGLAAEIRGTYLVINLKRKNGKAYCSNRWRDWKISPLGKPYYNQLCLTDHFGSSISFNLCELWDSRNGPSLTLRSIFAALEMDSILEVLAAAELQEEYLKGTLDRLINEGRISVTENEKRQAALFSYNIPYISIYHPYGFYDVINRAAEVEAILEKKAAQTPS